MLTRALLLKSMTRLITLIKFNTVVLFHLCSVRNVQNSFDNHRANQSFKRLIIALASDFDQISHTNHATMFDSFEENSRFRLYLTFIRTKGVCCSKKENKREQWRSVVDEKTRKDSRYHRTRYLYRYSRGFIHVVLRIKGGTLRKETEWERTNGRDLIDPFSSNFRIHPGSSTNQQVRRPLIRDCLNYPEGNRRDDLQIFNNACCAKIPRTVGVKAFPCARNISRPEE